MCQICQNFLLFSLFLWGSMWHMCCHLRKPDPSQCQSGFTCKHSTNTALLDVLNYFLQNANDCKVIASIFSGPKESIWYCKPWFIKNLNSYGIRGKALDWFKSYLSGRTQAFYANSTLSNFKNIEIGVPQGSILGPFLFIIFVNSLPDSIYNGCKCVMYADDTTLLLDMMDRVKANMINPLLTNSSETVSTLQN